MSSVAIVDYGLGNLRSVAGAIKKLGFEPVITSDGAEIWKADRLIMPGVGAFGDGMNNLTKTGLLDALNEAVIKKGRPILGICLGSQLMANDSYEFGHFKGLGWVDASVVKLETDKELRIPHVGWNGLIRIRKCVLFDDIPADALFYYVHSFHIKCNRQDIVTGECEYGVRFTAAFQQGNIYAAQFHPEKSQYYGLMFLKNFLTKT